MIRCTECKKNIIKDTAYTDWLRLLHFIEFLHLQGDISDHLFEQMVDAMMTFKLHAVEESGMEI